MVQLLISPASFSAAAAIATGITPPPNTPPCQETLSVLSYNVLLPNSVDGWWNYKMYDPPLSEDRKYIASWDYRKNLIRERLALIDADVVCFQEVAPVSFEDDFQFMKEIGYDGVELFKKGRFRPATFWKSSQVELVTPAVHKDRTLLTSFRPTTSNQNDKDEKKSWHVLNCHLQAGKQAGRRVRQIHEGVRAVMTLARKLKEKSPEESVRLIVCGDFNGGSECGAVRYLEDGYVDETFMEDGEPVSSSKKAVPLNKPLMDAVTTVTRQSQEQQEQQSEEPPPTMVVCERIKVMVEGAADIDCNTTAYENPKLSKTMLERLERIFQRYANGKEYMDMKDVEKWLVVINGQVGRGSEFREAGRQMGWKPSDPDNKDEKITLPPNGHLSLEGFVQVYQEELMQGKFWGIAYDMAVLGEPLPDVGTFHGRYDRMYCSDAIEPSMVMDTISQQPCPNEFEPSDHLPVAASFIIKKREK